MKNTFRKYSQFYDLLGFKVKKKYKWLTFDDPNFDTWYAVWVLEKI